MKKLKKLSPILFILLVWILTLEGCVEPYFQSYRTSNKIIIVEGTLSNDTGLNPILIKESTPSPSGSSNFSPIKGAKVSIIINDKTTISLTEKDDGAYYFDSNFKGEVGSTYQLKFTTIDGISFESKIEKMLPSIPIEKTFHQIDTKGIVDAKGNTTPGIKFYLDVQDPANTADNYLWDWALYEKQSICKSCQGGLYYRTPAPYGGCVDDANLRRFNNVYDYLCEGNCWEIIRSTEMVVNNDEIYNGKLIKAQYIGKIPIYQHSPALLEINQYSISKETYNFIRLAQKQGIETGGLADTPPAQLVGNVTCTSDRAINTSGYFIVAGKTKSNYWLDKEDIIAQKLLPIGLLGGRVIRLEPSGASTTRPPYSFCINGLNRTNQQPKGWRN